jgi:predicted PurR-regulated permease PerM
MKELKENSEKSKEARRLRLLVIIVLIVLLVAYLLVALGFIIPAIPISLISEYNKELNGYINAAKAWNSLYNPLLTELNLFASSTSQGSKDFQLNKITKVKQKFF